MSKKLILKKLEYALKMNNEFLDKINEADLKLTIPEVRSSTIGSQLHCIIGARNSYFKCISDNREFSWKPDFDYDDRFDLKIISDLMINKSKTQMDNILSINKLTDNQLDLVIDLISHEFMHQGQLIRYLYANKISMPKMTKKFWHLED